MRTNDKVKKCFIITPIGDENSDTFRRAKGVIESVIKPVLKENGFDDIKPAYEINVSGMINTQIINRIIDDDLVIANLTGNNPNVMYELCLRHVVAKPIIHICENGTILPFDIKDNRTIFYKNDMLGVDELKTALYAFLKNIEYKADCKDNPIYNAHKLGNLLKSSDDTEKSTEINLLLDIFNTVSELNGKTPISIMGSSGVMDIHQEYTVNEFIEDIQSVDKERIINARDFKNKQKVHEVAKTWNVLSKVIVYTGRILGIPLKSQLSSIDVADIRRIADYICMIDSTKK